MVSHSIVESGLPCFGSVLSRGYVLLDPDARSDLIEVLKMAVFSKLVIVWTVYFLWVALFVNIADWVGIWRAVLTKDTLLWSATAGLALLIGSTEASEPGYFRRAFSKVLSVIVIFEYLVNFITFPVWIEIPLQLILFSFRSRASCHQETRKAGSVASHKDLVLHHPDDRHRGSHGPNTARVMAGDGLGSSCAPSGMAYVTGNLGLDAPVPTVGCHVLRAGFRPA